nr:MobF family relaxase [Roseomonas sp. KE0001]
MTFRKGAASSAPSGGRAMADHLMEETLSQPAVDMADYYTRNRAVELGAGTGPEGEAGPEAPRQGTRPQPRRDMHPRLAAALGLEPHSTLSLEQVSQILGGRRADGAELVTNDATTTRSISYIDLCFSAPKSVSLAWAFAPTEAERATILQAHREAVDATLRYVAQDIGVARRGKGGEGAAEPGHIGWISFEHFTARPTVEVVRTDAVTGEAVTELHTLRPDRDPTGAGDPQLHTHNAVPNLVVTEGGHVGALDLTATRTRIHEYGAVYQAQLAANLTRASIAVELEERTGMARLPAIPEAVCQEFSKRTRDGEQAAREEAVRRGLDWDRMTPEMRIDFLKGGTHAARKSKTDDLSDFAAWREQAETLGWRHQSVIWLEGTPPLPHRSARLAAGYENAIPLLEAEFGRSAVLNGADLRSAAARALIAAGMTPGAEGARADVDALTRTMRQHGVRQDGQQTALIWGRESDRGEVRVTTALHVEQEQEAVDLARTAAGDRSRALSPRAIQQAAQKAGLSFLDAHGQAQRRAMLRLGTGGAVGVAIGVAGSGKTTLLRPLVDAWTAQGDAVIGVALAWRQAEPLKAAGIDRTLALAGFLKAAQEERIVLGRNSVVVLDELGQVGARQMLALLRLRARHGFRLVAVGDDKQCQSIEAGPVITLMRRALGPEAVPEILTTRRQQSEREQQIAGLFRAGRAAEALELKREDGTAEVVPGGYGEAVQRVAALWRARREAHAGDAGFTLSVSAPTNADARAIASAIREQRRAMGELGADCVSLLATDQTRSEYTLTLAPGDRVRLFDRVNARLLSGGRGNIGHNGSVLEFRAVTPEGLVLRTAAGHDGLVTWDSLRDRSTGRTRLAPGDVLTIDAAQGLTSHEHINALPGGTAAIQGYKGYTAESRHTHRSWLITSEGAERREVQQRRALGDRRPIAAEHVWENMARNLSRQPEKASALVLLERVQGVSRGAARSLQRGLHRAEVRDAAGQRPTTLSQRTRQQRERQAMGEMAMRLKQVLEGRWRSLRDLAQQVQQRGWGRPAASSAAAQTRIAAAALTNRAAAEQTRAGGIVARYRKPQANQVPTEPSTYWQRLIQQRERKPSLRRPTQRKRDEQVLAAVADRLAVALGERQEALQGLRQSASLQPVPAPGQAPMEPPPTAPAPASAPAGPRRSTRPARARAPQTPASFSASEAMAGFVAELQRAGLKVSGTVEMDGTLRRVPVEGDRKGQKSGAYVGHLDGWPAGYIRNHKTGTEIRWKADRPSKPLTAEQRSALAAETAVRAAERAKERQAVQARAARLAQKLWEAARPAAAHPYLAAKGVHSHGLRQDTRGRLLVPVQGIDGSLWGLQRIGVDGSKLFLKGARTEGGHALIGTPKSGQPLLIAEGYATGATLHAATHLPVAVAFNASNLETVAKAYRAHDPKRPIVIAGDNDHHLPRRSPPLPNVGREKAEAAAAAVGGAVALPTFSPDDRGTDWNDLAKRQGNKPVTTAVEHALRQLPAFIAEPPRTTSRHQAAEQREQRRAPRLR